MKVNIYADHLAYTLEVGESVYTLGMKFIKKPNENMLPMASAKVNGNTRLMYETSDLEPLQDLKGRVATSDLAIALKSLIDSIKRIEDNDFLKINSIDINYQRLFYDKKTNHIRYAVLPVNYDPELHDGMPWSTSFKNTILIILGDVFRDRVEIYSEMYYQIMGDTMTDHDVIEYLSNYDFNIRAAAPSIQNRKQQMPAGGMATQMAGVQTVASQTASSQTAVSDSGRMPIFAALDSGLILEHRGRFGSIVFNVNQPKFVLGSSKTVDGPILTDSAVSRKHCTVYMEDGNYLVEDMGSTNGTRINGYALSPGTRYMIKTGDILSVADVDFAVSTH
ncbi:MAG: FHA domain-containing protein [Eubacterium sp.]|nr:FHA domain-containing protein [Eubacterium sp.]